MKTKNEIRGEALKFLKEHNTAVVATSFEGEPYASTVYYVVDDEFSFYFVTKANSSKYINTLFNGRVALVVGTGPKHITVQARGTADTFESNPESLLEKFKELQAQGSFENWPINIMEQYKDEKAFHFKFVPMLLTFMNANDETYPASLGTHYHQIIPQEE